MKASGLPYPPKLMQVLSFLCTSKCHHYPLPVGSLNLYHELLKAGNAREILKKKSLSWTLPSIFVSQHTATDTTGCEAAVCADSSWPCSFQTP